jgi:uncharacterized paraquat-inducible protein A
VNAFRDGAGALAGALQAVSPIPCDECNASTGDTWPPVRHPEYARCPHCGHVSPTEQYLDRHLLRFCCGTLGRAA